jgi:hypothetical protein
MMNDEFEDAILGKLYDGWTDAEIMVRVAELRAELEGAIGRDRRPVQARDE